MSKEELAAVSAVMHMVIDEAWENCFSSGIYDPSVRRKIYRSGRYTSNKITFNHNGGLVHRFASVPVNESTAVNYDRGCLRRHEITSPSLSSDCDVGAVTSAGCVAFLIAVRDSYSIRTKMERIFTPG